MHKQQSSDAQKTHVVCDVVTLRGYTIIASTGLFSHVNCIKPHTLCSSVPLECGNFMDFIMVAVSF